MKTLSILIIIIMSNNYAFSQASVIQDGDGETSYQIDRSLFTLNATNTAVGFSIGSLLNNHDLNFNGSFEAKNGTAKIFDDGKLSFSGKVGATFIYNDSAPRGRGEAGPVSIKHWYFTGEILHSKLNIYDSLKSFKEQVYIEKTLGFKLTIGRNWINSFWGVTAGMSISGGIKDNSDKLEQSEIITSTFTQSEGIMTRTHSTTENVYTFKEFQSDKKFSSLNFDIGDHIWNGRLFPNFHLNYSIMEDFKPILDTSIGLFYMENGAPLEAIAGVQLQLSDVNNTLKSDLNTWERASLVLTIGFPFD